VEIASSTSSLSLSSKAVREGGGKGGWKVDLPNRRDESDDFDAVDGFEVFLSNRPSSDTT
jgi:hypothetical protein